MTPHPDLIEARDAVCGGWLQRALRRGLARLTATDVHGVGVGPKVVLGRTTSTLAVRFYVGTKTPRSALPWGDRLPNSIDGLPVDIIASPAATLSASPVNVPFGRKRVRPVCPGVSAGIGTVPFGTIAAFCRSTRAGEGQKVLVLSNNHVLANFTAVGGEPIFQPGRDDSLGDPNRFASLLRAFHVEPGSLLNRIDAAVAELDTGIDFNPVIPDKVGKVLGSTPPVVPNIVCKFGRTTEYTEGKITDANYTCVIGIDPSDDSRVATFVNQVRIDRRDPDPIFADKGDSGALIVEKGTGMAVGLYFAGPFDGSYGLANPIADVLERLEIALIV